MNTLTQKRFIAVVIVLTTFTSLGKAAVRLAAPFGEHMVLQQGVVVPIWGTGAPGGDTVRVSFDGQSVTTHSDWEGRWLVNLSPMKAGGPYQMMIEVGGLGPIVPSSAANSRGGAELNDVVVGEVRVLPSAYGGAVNQASGATTSTQQWQPILRESTEAPSAWIRIFESSNQTGHWRVQSIDSAAGGSADAYSYARQLYKQLHVPVGVIENSTGLASALNR